MTPVVGYICLDCHRAGATDTFRTNSDADCPNVGPGEHASWWPLVTVAPDEAWVKIETYRAVWQAWEVAEATLEAIANGGTAEVFAQLVLKMARNLIPEARP